MAPGEVRTLLLQLEPFSNEPVLETDVFLPDGRQRHRLTLPTPVPAGPVYQQVAFEQAVVQLRRLYTQLSGLEGPGETHALLEATRPIRATLQGHPDPRSCLPSLTSSRPV
jgi:hypothetical protein